jgi:hypothetical protein
LGIEEPIRAVPIIHVQVKDVEQELVFSESRPQAMNLKLVQDDEHVRGIRIFVPIDVTRNPILLPIVIRESLPFAQTLHCPYAFLHC